VDSIAIVVAMPTANDTTRTNQITADTES